MSSIDRNSWSIIKSFMFVECDCCSTLFTARQRCGYNPFASLVGKWVKCDGCKKNLCTMRNTLHYSCEGPIHCQPCIDKMPICRYCDKKSHHEIFECSRCTGTYHVDCPYSESGQFQLDPTTCSICRGGYPDSDSDNDPSAWQNT